MPSQNFFGTIDISWSYDSAKQELTVSGTLSGKAMNGSPVTLKKSSATGQFTGQSGSNSATVGLSANFDTRKLTMNPSQTDPQRSSTNTSDF
jgi:hypothetical protein